MPPRIPPAVRGRHPRSPQWHHESGFITLVSSRDAHPSREARVVHTQETVMIRSFPPSPLAALMSMVLAAGIAGCASTGSAPSAAPAPPPAAAKAPAPAPATAAAPAAAGKLPVLTVFGDKGAVAPYT